jgi:hypothetical protein
MEEAFAPQADYVTPDRKGGGDLVVGLTLRSKENHSGSKYRKIRQRILPSTTFQNLLFLLRQIDCIRAFSRHTFSLKRKLTEESRLYNTLPYLRD